MRLAVIGCAFFAQNHLDGWRDLAADGVQLVAVCDINQRKAEEVAKTFAVPRFYAFARQGKGRRHHLLRHRCDLEHLRDRRCDHRRRGSRSDCQISRFAARGCAALAGWLRWLRSTP